MRATICCLFLVLLPVTAPAAGSMPGVTRHSRVVQVTDGSRLQATITSETRHIAVEITSDKEETNRILGDLGLPILRRHRDQRRS